MRIWIFRKARGGFAGLITTVALMFSLSPAAHATLLNFEFVSVVQSGEFIFPSGPGHDLVGLDGSPVTVSGMTTSDTDLAPGDDSVGIFEALVTFDFGPLGSFTSDPGTTFYVQACDTPSSFSCLGVLFNFPSLVEGFGSGIAPVASDPNIAVALGAVTLDHSVLFGQNSGTLTNSSDETLRDLIIRGDNFVSSITVTAKPPSTAPEPSTLILIVSCLAGIAIHRRRQLEDRSNAARIRHAHRGARRAGIPKGNIGTKA